MAGRTSGISFLKVPRLLRRSRQPQRATNYGSQCPDQAGVVTTQTYAPATYLRPRRTRSFEVGF